ncbi:hypothetical protein F5Y19DRAFT_481736 [Xylariaceae sp. FL1651]|nr:hypothetical protein F5Y19DRAFT_481736 [Xylariaceae sp. FL1651]
MSASQSLSGLSLLSYTNDKETFTKLLVPVEQAEKSGQQPRSPASGFNGVVIPSHFVTQTDDRAAWGVQYAPRNEKFVLMQGDLGPGNVMIDLTTLEFKAIID